MNISSKKKILVCIGSSRFGENLVHTAATMAKQAREAELFAVHVDAGRRLIQPREDGDQVSDNLSIAKHSGAQTVTLKGHDVAETVSEYARQRGITDIVVGRPGRSILTRLLMRSPVDQLLGIDGTWQVHIIPEEEGVWTSHQVKNMQLADYGSGILLWVLATVLCYAMFPFFDLSNLIMVYLLAVLITAIGCGRGPAVLNSFLCVLSFDFCFVPPRYTFTVDDAQYFVTFAVMFVIALVISSLASRLRKEAMTARLQERQTKAMHGLSRQLAGVRGIDNILQTAERYISEIFHCRVIALLPDETGKLAVASGDPTSVIRKDMIKEVELAQSVLETGRISGWNTPHSSTVEILCVPLQASRRRLGTLALRPEDASNHLSPPQMALLESLAQQIALALEVEHLSQICPSSVSQAISK